MRRVSISIPDEVFKVLEEIREREGLRRSDVITEALVFYFSYVYGRDVSIVSKKVKFVVKLSSGGEFIKLVKFYGDESCDESYVKKLAYRLVKKLRSEGVDVTEVKIYKDDQLIMVWAVKNE